MNDDLVPKPVETDVAATLNSGSTTNIPPTFASLASTSASSIDQMYTAALARLKSNDPKARAELDAAFAKYRACHQHFTVSVFLLIDDP
jgi:hypothetical protein